MQDDHIRDFVGYGPNPPNPNWPGGARLALNFVVNVEEGSEASVPDGDSVSEFNLTELAGADPGIKGRDLAAEGMFEYGSRAGLWRIFRLFQSRGVPLTVFGCAKALERNQAAADAIKAAGYDVCCHGLRWIKHSSLSEAEERAQIREAIASLTRTVGTRPLGWYCRYTPSVNTRRLLVEEGGFLYDSDAYNDDLPYWVTVTGKPHLVVPYTLANNDAKFARGSFAIADHFFSYMRDAFDVLYEEGKTAPKMMSVGLHMRLIGHPGRFAGLQRFLDHVQRYTDVWLCRRIDIAQHWVAQHPFAARR
jgi:putative urate catabolism protein